MMHKISGIAETREVFIEGKKLSPNRSLKVFNHSPDGFNWGYGGSGPAQLALAVLLEHCKLESVAVKLHQKFKFDIIAGLPQGKDFLISMNIKNWIDEKLAGSNIGKPPIEVVHQNLEPYGDGAFDSVCPECGEGLLPVRRDQKTFEIQRTDYCLLCGQEYLYIGTAPGRKVA